MLNATGLNDVRSAEVVVRQHFSPSPLIRSYPLERELGLSASRRVWLKDYGWTPVRSFKLMGAINWMAHHQQSIGSRPVAAHSSGNFASGIAFAAMRYEKKVIIVMPDDAPKTKFDLTRSFGAEIRTYKKATDHITGDRQRMTREIADQFQAMQASPYDDPHVIAGNGVGGLEIAKQLNEDSRGISHFLCPVSGGGLMAGHALVVADQFPTAKIVGVEPDGADDFRRSLSEGKRVRMERPESICDGLLSYDVGRHNWPILKQYVTQCAAIPDVQTRRAMKWLYDHHGLRTEPSGAIAIAAALSNQIDFAGDGDVVLIISGRNVDQEAFAEWIDV